MSRATLMAFQAVKLLLMAHSQPGYCELGRFVAAINLWKSINDCAFAYRSQLMAQMRQCSSRRGHTNVLQHIQGYFSISKAISATNSVPDSYLMQQRYFDPYPEVLRLRYGH